MIGPDLRVTDDQKRREPFDAFPYLCQDGWLWTARPFGRKSLDGGKRELFPPLTVKAGEKGAGNFTPKWMQRIDAASLLIGDGMTLWVVELRQEKKAD